MTDREVRELFGLIMNTASSLEKQRILSENSGDEAFRKFLNCLLNPFCITGISEKKISKEVSKPPTRSFDTFLLLMDYVLQNNTGSDEVIANIRAFLDAQEEDMRGFYVSIVTKSAKLGCDVKSVNKAFAAAFEGKEFIPQWEVQQSYNIEKSPLKENEWFSLTEKLNGVRGTYCNGKIVSRQGKEIAGLEHIVSDINALFDDAKQWVLDGELIRKNTDGVSDNENFRIGTGILSRDDADKSCMQLVIFDMLPVNEFQNGESALTYKQRLEQLRTLTDKIKHLGLASIRTVEALYTGTDAEMIDKLLDKMVSEDKEGLMLNRDSKYYCKRHNGILKVKRFYTVDLRVTGFEEGSGRLAGTFGAFVVDYKGNSLNVGSGMTDEQRSEFWAMRERLVGRVIEVKYKEESTDKKTGLCSLQFPIFVALREEGKRESYY